MKIYNLPRGCGKTTALVLCSYLTQKTILTAYEPTKKNIMETAKRFNLLIPEPITVMDFFTRKISWQHLLIDDYDKVSKIIVEKTLGMPVDIAFMTADNDLDQGDWGE